MNSLDFHKKKKNGEKICMVTCYDYTSAKLLAKTSIDCVLVGDSVAMTMHGYQDTLSATLPMMCTHTHAVKRGLDKQFIISDMPFLSYRKSLSKNVSAAESLMQAGAQAIKLECATGNIKLIRHLTESGIPVMGHLGLTPQFIHVLGGYKVQGKTEESAAKLKEDALRLQDAGCFAIVLECVPTLLAKEITESLSVPTIGIGAGPFTDGQVLVFQDLLGLNSDFLPKFAHAFVSAGEQITQGVESYIEAVKIGNFPQNEHCYGN